MLDFKSQFVEMFGNVNDNKNSYEINFGKIKENENKNNRINRNNETKEEKSLIRIPNEKWYRRLLRKILEIFKVS